MYQETQHLLAAASAVGAMGSQPEMEKALCQNLRIPPGYKEYRYDLDFINSTLVMLDIG